MMFSRPISFEGNINNNKFFYKMWIFEGNPTTEFIDLVLANKPDQVTLVPDDPGQLTSNHGWDTNNNKGFLIDVIGRFREAGIRTSIFVDPVMNIVAGAAKTGADRIELYTESYALGYIENKSEAVKPFIETAVLAKELGLGLNAGHDLSLINLNYFVEKIPWLKEVSIGHALICDSLNYGLENTIQLYLRELKIS
ncbi:MAG: pyridoxine 5'-phosphate synthase [Bacteroidetes bacterium]|nr:pyridoxine 5'-phosphate synthase [Bacteroidota bacterium]